MRRLPQFFMTLFMSIALPVLAFAAGERIDPSLAKTDSLAWYDVRLLDVEGKGWTDTKSFFDRLPARAESIVREPVWNLSLNSAGICVRFATDATKIFARWSLRSESLAMPHMPATGVSGLDLYVKGTDGKYHWLGAGRPEKFPMNTAVLVDGISPERHEYILYLPLYNGVESVEIGLKADDGIYKAEPRPADRKPILFYGTSITQGGCASRTGMVHTAIIGRRLDYPVINLGFSGNGRMEQEMADLLAELDPSVYVLDCLPNMTGDMVKERVEPFVKTLRNAHPDTPILFVEDRTYSNAYLLPLRHKGNLANRAELLQAYFRLKDEGVPNLFYLPGNKLLGDDMDNEGTVDSSHPTDLGFMRQAEVMMTALKPILNLDTSPLMDEEWRRTGPDITVFIPKGNHDGDNEHFLVFEAPKSGELLALWTQSSAEGRGDNRIVLARSLDGESWSDPVMIAGSAPGRNDPQASWGFPIVADTGRIYCFFTKEIEKFDARQSSGAMGCMYSDDNGFTWTAGNDIVVPKTKYDNPDPGTPPNWIVWQKPIRDSNGRWIAGYTRTSSEKAVKKPNANWTDTDSRSAFVRFDNIAEGPDPEKIRLTWLPKSGEGIEVSHKVYPQISVCQEPALLLLPDGRLFAVMRTMTGNIWYSVSDNDGESWRAPEPLRYRDKGDEIKNPMAPSPLFSLSDGRYLLVFNNNDGRKDGYDQFRKQWAVNQLNYLRNPAFIAVGEFRPKAHQPVWFSTPKKLLDTEGIVFGPKGTASVAMYPSLTEHGGKRVLWYPDRKHFLLGKELPDSLLSDMTVPK